MIIELDTLWLVLLRMIELGSYADVFLLYAPSRRLVENDSG